MADRRMFSSSIVCSDAFLSMSIQARCLYYHLVIEADNRGFVSTAIQLMQRLNDLSKANLNELIDKKFIIKINDYLYLIKHWYIHNDIPTCKIEESHYLEELENIYLDLNNSYTTRKTSKNALEFLISNKKPFKENKDKYKCKDKCKYKSKGKGNINITVDSNSNIDNKEVDTLLHEGEGTLDDDDKLFWGIKK